MKVVFIGAGNLAYHLSKALHKSGFQIAQIYSRSEASAKELALLFHVPYTTSITNVFDNASLYIISVSDDAIESVATNFRSTEGLVIHTSGSVPMEILSGKNKNFGVFYPFQTFSKNREIDFSKIPIFLEANSQKNLEILQYIAKGISNQIFLASSQQRMQVHLSGVFCCNFVNHLYQLSAEMTHHAGFEFDVLTPLILETARKAITTGNPGLVQTGPAIRNDSKVINKHLEFLSHNLQVQKIYSILSEDIMKK